MTMFIFITLVLSISPCLSLNKDASSASESGHLASLEALIKTVIIKNQELERRVELLETELHRQKIVNDELLDRISVLETGQQVIENLNVEENDVHNEVQGRNETINDRTEQASLWVARQDTPKAKRNQNRGIKRLLLPPQTTPSVTFNHATVAFTAYLSTDATNLGAGQAIIFDHVITNVGGGFHKSHGNFIAPRNGVYVFTLMAMARPGHYEHLDFVKDGISLGQVYVGAPSNSNFMSTSGVITVSLSRGNEVWVRTAGASWHGTGKLHGGFVSSFSGWLLSL